MCTYFLRPIHSRSEPFFREIHLRALSPSDPAASHAWLPQVGVWQAARGCWVHPVGGQEVPADSNQAAVGLWPVQRLVQGPRPERKTPAASWVCLLKDVASSLEKSLWPGAPEFLGCCFLRGLLVGVFIFFLGSQQLASSVAGSV